MTIPNTAHPISVQILLVFLGLEQSQDLGIRFLGKRWEIQEGSCTERLLGNIVKQLGNNAVQQDVVKKKMALINDMR